MENNNFRGIPTSLFLNGPKLGIVTDPQDVTDVVGFATFTGITTASFPNPTDGVNDGSITFNWYYDGNLVSDSDSNITIVGFNTATGTGSTLTVSGISTENDNGKEVYFVSDYTPSAYSQPAGSAVTAGTARSTGNAFNEPLTSAVASISLKPEITISTQPEAETVAIDNDATFTISASILPSIFSLLYQWQVDGQDLPSSGDFTSGSDTFTVSGGQSETLTISCDNTTSASITCKLRPDSRSTPEVISDAVTLSVVGTRNLLKIEQYDYANESGTFTSHNLDNGSLTIRYSSHPGNAVCFYAAEKDLNVEIDMYAGPGDDNGPYKGGKGGTSRIQFTMKKEEEYIVTGLFSSINAPFLYRQSSLIAVVGAGGDAGVRNGGGDGGGIGIAGGDGPVDAVGGERIATGELPSNGIFGSLSGIAAASLLEGDTRAAEPNGGRTLSCPRGLSYPTKAPCELVGSKRFRLPNSTDDIPDSADISRGYKSGYNIIQTAGKGDVASDGGNGGAGATGGRGGRNGNGGGGGSGYTDGSVTVFPDILGDGSTDNARIEIRLQS